MKINWFKNLKIIGLGLLLSVGLSYVFAQTPSNPERPIYANSDTQYKEGALSVGSPTLALPTGDAIFDVKGLTGVLGTKALFSSTIQSGGLSVLNDISGGTINMNVVQVNGDIRSSNLETSAPMAVCANPSGVYVLCSRPGEPSVTYTLTANWTGLGEGVVKTISDITADPIPGIDCSDYDSDCTETYNSDDSVILRAYPASYATFTGWTVNGSTTACPGVGHCTITMNADKTITANFIPLTTYTLTVNKTGSGTVMNATGSQYTGINCGTDCTETYNSGNYVTLIATPASGSTFYSSNWTGCTYTYVASGNRYCIVHMNAPKSVTANFVLTTYTLTVAKSITGSVPDENTLITATGINCGTTCQANYNSGTPVTLSVIFPYYFTSWSGCDSVGNNPDYPSCTVTMNATRTVMANFATTTTTPTWQAVSTTSPTVGNLGQSCQAFIESLSNKAPYNNDYTTGLRIRFSVEGSSEETYLGNCVYVSDNPTYGYVWDWDTTDPVPYHAYDFTNSLLRPLALSSRSDATPTYTTPVYVKKTMANPFAGNAMTTYYLRTIYTLETFR